MGRPRLTPVRGAAPLPTLSLLALLGFMLVILAACGAKRTTEDPTFRASYGRLDAQLKGIGNDAARIFVSGASDRRAGVELDRVASRADVLLRGLMRLEPPDRIAPRYRALQRSLTRLRRDLRRAGRGARTYSLPNWTYGRADASVDLGAVRFYSDRLRSALGLRSRRG